MAKPSRHIENKFAPFVALLMVGLGVALFTIPAHAQQPSTIEIPQHPTAATPTQSPKVNSTSRRIQALRVTDEIKIDGLLNEPGWFLAQPANDFLQQQPNEGVPASEKTEVRVLFDNKNLYVGIHAFDSEPQHINARELVRDANFSNDDKIEILLDTYYDRRNAFRFAVNPLGTQQDALITDEGRDVNLSWHSPWISAGRIDQFTVARVKRDIFERSSIGAMFVNRQGAISSSGTRYNRSAGIDAEFNLTDHYQLKAFLMGTATPGVRSSFHSGRIDSRFENDLFRFITVYEDIGSNFNPEVGFVERSGIRQYFGQVAYKPRPKFIPYVRQMEFESQLEYYEDRSGHLATRQTELSWDTEFKNSASFSYRPIEDVTDVLEEPFEIRPGIVIPSGSYHFNRPRIEVASDRSKRIVLTGRYKWGDFYSGKRDEISGGIAFRPNAHLLFDFSDSFNRVRLAQGNFTTNLLVGRVNYNFSRKLLTSALMQLNSAARVSAVNIRLRYIYRPNSDFFIIYNQTSGTGLERPSYSFQLKLTRDFTF